MMIPSLFLLPLLVLRRGGFLMMTRLVRNDYSSTLRTSCLLPTTAAAAVPLQLQATLRREEDDNDDPLLESMRKIGWTQAQQDVLLQALQKAGLWENNNSNCSSSSSSSSHALLTICRHLEPERITRMLVDDFGLTPLMAHQIRAAVVQTYLFDKQQPQQQQPQQEEKADSAVSLHHQPATTGSAVTNERVTKRVEDTTDKEEENKSAAATATAATETDNKNVTETPRRRALYKSVVVNTAAKRRHQAQQKQKHSSSSSSSYGLSQKDLITEFPKLAMELDNFYTFMTQPTTGSQEDPIRPATATVYLQHARLFLGWYVRHHHNNKVVSSSSSKKKHLSLFDIIPNKNQESASCIVDFILWLRSERHISISYEANLLRGLTKMIKFRFAKESRQQDTGDAVLLLQMGSRSISSYQDIPAVQALRKLHRVANQQQKNAPRSSDEDVKWLDWPDYLQVVQKARTHVEQLLKEYNDNEKTNTVMAESNNEVVVTPQQRKIAVAFQKYLVLAFFANVPDRQRTIRELEIGRSFVKDRASDCWVIRHAPDDYKTGKTYGERPPLRLSSDLTDAIDTFLEEWRPCLQPSTDKLFVQPRTGNPLTRDSIYQIVGRVCYQYTGKRTNPHLLRDMIVTHIRESSDASEKELEALALYMGHSIHMQRTSYDRRTLTKKVAPAVELLEAVNSNTMSSIKNNNKDKKHL